MSRLYELAVAFAQRTTGAGHYRGYPTPTTTWKDACGALINQFGLFIGGWSPAPTLLGPSASDVMRASGPRNTNWRIAPLGAIHWFTLAGSIHGHVGIDLDGGGSNVLSATGRAVKERLAPYLGIHSVDGYVATGGVTYEGWTMNYGGGRSKYVEPAAPVIQPNQRQVLPSAFVRRRVLPTTLAEESGRAAAGSIQALSGWRYGQEVAGEKVWFTDGRGWFWAAGFTDKGTHDLVDLNPPPVVVEPEPEDPGDGPQEPAELLPAPQEPPVVPVTPEQEQEAVEAVTDLVEGKLDTGNAAILKIRTLVPIVVAPILGWLAIRYPELNAWLDDQAEGWQFTVFGAISAAAGYGWWTLARILGSRTWFGWDWSVVERVMLGSSAQPVYMPSPTPALAAVKRAAKLERGS